MNPPVESPRVCTRDGQGAFREIKREIPLGATAEYQRAWRVAHPAQSALHKRRWREANPDYVAARNAARRIKPHELICARCGSAFLAGRRDRRYCSGRCRRSPYEDMPPLTMSQLVARYGAICWLCHEPLDLTLRWPTPMYPSFDHVVPRALGGGHELANLRPAHWICNSVRGDGTKPRRMPRDPAALWSARRAPCEAGGIEMLSAPTTHDCWPATRENPRYPRGGLTR